MTAGDGSTVRNLAEVADNSWLNQLTPDPETERYAPNKTSRQVKSGHYVKLLPTPLNGPRLVAYSPSMARALGISDEDALSPTFAAFFSGDMSAVPGMESWATPYALSIMGQRQSQNCPFGNGNGYGDGRAISIGEVVVNGQRWEMQLKGGGTTPFCRGADGRAVLRSSIREFLASEAMHSLGVSTTRALSLVVSDGGDNVRRPWYSNRGSTNADLSMDDPRIANFPEAVRMAMVNQALTQRREPDVMMNNKCAITTRVAPSFLRIGHVDLFARRAISAGPGTPQFAELEQIVAHAIFREYPEVAAAGGTTAEQTRAFLAAAGQRICHLMGEWLRVGFCQGNFNADNCLVGGRTMDYGPFGFMDQYDPAFAKWVGSGRHFAFDAQPTAGYYNFVTLAQSCIPLLGGTEQENNAQASAIVHEVAAYMEACVADIWRRKLGLPDSPEARAQAEELWEELEPLMRRSSVDYTLMWRQLAEVVTTAEKLPKGKFPGNLNQPLPDDVALQLMQPLMTAFYDNPYMTSVKEWSNFLRRWLLRLDDAKLARERLLSENPKYVLREWMLVEAYTAAESSDDMSVVHDLFKCCCENPYGEGTQAQSAKWYRLPPDHTLRLGGTAFMT